MLAGALAAGALAGCASRTTVAPAAPAGQFTPTACERHVLRTGQAPDVTSPEAVAESLRWGVLAPETCPEAGRLDEGSPPGSRR